MDADALRNATQHECGRPEEAAVDLSDIAQVRCATSADGKAAAACRLMRSRPGSGRAWSHGMTLDVWTLGTLMVSSTGARRRGTREERNRR